MSPHAAEARRSATFFQAPLCVFAYGASEKDRLRALIHYAIVEAGATHWTRLSEQQRSAFLAAESEPGELPAGFDAHKPWHAAAACGARLIRCTLGSFRRVLDDHNSLRSFRQQFEDRHGADPLVRLRSGLVFEALDGGGITPRELAVLAAIFSVIGRKQGPVLITQDRIRCRALGYKTAAVMKDELPRRTDGAGPLSAWQLRSLLDRLQARKFFARATYGRRQSFYSHRMRQKDLQLAVIERKTYRMRHDYVRRLGDADMTAVIRNQRAALADRPPPVPDAHPLSFPPAFSPEDVA